MAAGLRAAEPQTPLVRGEGNRLLLAAGTFGAITYAQAWHRTDPDRSDPDRSDPDRSDPDRSYPDRSDSDRCGRDRFVPDAVRVVRRPGVPAPRWNQADVGVSWAAAEGARPVSFTRGSPAAVAGLFAAFPVHVRARETVCSHRISVEEHIGDLGAHSHFAVTDSAGRAGFLGTCRTVPVRLFPGWPLLWWPSP